MDLVSGRRRGARAAPPPAEPMREHEVYGRRLRRVDALRALVVDG